MIEVTPNNQSIVRYVVACVLALGTFAMLAVLVYAGRMTSRDLFDVVSSIGGSVAVALLIMRM